MNIKLLRSLWLKDLHKHPGGMKKDFKKWVASGIYRINSINGQSEISLSVLDIEPFIDSIAYDIARFSCASIESLEGINETINFPKSTAWTAIRFYYSAYYAAHSIIRVFGLVFSQLDDSSIRTLNQYANSIYGITTTLKNSGNYQGQFDPTSGQLKLIYKKDSHRDLWKAFVTLLKRLSSDVLQVNGLTKEKQSLSASLINLVDALEKNGVHQGGNWLSSYRNEINYRHEHGAWFPYSKDSIRFNEIKKFLSPWRQKMESFDLLLSEKNEIKKFYATCFSVNMLCRCLIDDLSSTAPNNNIQNSMAIAFRKRSEAPPN